MSTKTSSSSYSSTEESYSSEESDNIELSHVNNILIEDLCFLLTRNKFFTDPDQLVFIDKIFIVSNDVVLYYILLLDYSKMRSLIDKKVKKRINKFLKDNKVSINNLVLVFADKLCNLNIKEIVNAYKTLKFTSTNYIFISKCYYPSKEEKEEFLELFSDYKESLEILPVKIEEIFLNKFSKKKNINIGGVPFQMHLINNEDIKKYINILENEE